MRRNRASLKKKNPVWFYLGKLGSLYFRVSRLIWGLINQLPEVYIRCFRKEVLSSSFMGRSCKMASCSSSGCGGHRRGSKKREVPYQDFSRIKSNVLGKIQRNQTTVSATDLYTDPSFPPNQSSLTYVYSGDDKYEKIEFKRPKVRFLLLSWHSEPSPVSSRDRIPL